MSFHLNFSNTVPAWTKLGTAEFFRILDDPENSETDIQKKAGSMGISWDKNLLYIEAESEDKVNKFLEFCADWYTKNKLTVSSNYDLLIEYDSEGKSHLGESPIKRPSTLGHVITNPSNYKPSKTKEIKLEELSEDLRADIESIRKTGIFRGQSYEGLKNAKLWPTERYIQFNVISTTGKKGTCFGCGAVDYLTDTKSTQYPTTVGVENFANFFSNLKRRIGFCRACSISNHFAQMRVMYFSNRESIFLAVPESNSISELMEFLKMIEDVYQIQKLEKSFFQGNSEERLLLSRTNYQYSNFVEKPQKYSGFYYLILAMFVAIRESLKEIQYVVKDNLSLSESAFMKEIMKSSKTELPQVEYTKALYRSWIFILLIDNQIVRSWRYQSAPEALKIIDSISQKLSSHNFLSLISKVVYKSGNSWIDSRREELARSILYGNPSMGILERYSWDAVFSGGNIPYGIQELVTIFAMYALGGNEMEKENIIKQCKSIGMKVSELAAEDNSKSLLYELRSVGNAQSLRTFIERLTFLSVLKGKEIGISNEFIDAITEGEEWNKYKSIIAIVANQRFLYLSGARKTEVAAE